MRRTKIVTAAAVAVLAVGGTVADAAIKKGTFKGKTSEKDPVGFKVTKTHKVTSFYFEGVKLHCSQGGTTETPTGKDDRIQINNLKFPISKKRKFKIDVYNGDTRDDSSIQIKANGTFNRKGRKAAGKLHVTAVFNSDGQLDPQGDDVCTSHKLPYTAKRK